MHEVSYKNNIKVSFNLCKREKVPSLDGEVANAFNIVAVFMILHVNGAELRLRKSTTFFLNTLRPYTVWHYQLPHHLREFSRVFHCSQILIS